MTDQIIQDGFAVLNDGAFAIGTIEDCCCEPTPTPTPTPTSPTCDNYESPETITLTIAGLSNCSSPTVCGELECDCETHIEGTWVLDLVSPPGQKWSKVYAPTALCRLVELTGCFVNIDNLIFQVEINCVDEEWDITVQAGWGSFGDTCFLAESVPFTICDDPVVVNNEKTCSAPLRPWKAIDGTASVSGLCV